MPTTKGNHCIDCGTPIWRKSTRCKSCAMKHKWAQGDYDGNDFGADKRRQPELYICPYCEGPKSRTAKQCRSCSSKRIWQNPEYRQNQANKTAKAWKNGVYNDSQPKAIATITRYARSENGRKRASEIAKEKWRNGVLTPTQPNPTSIEVAISDELDLRGLNHISQYKPDNCSYTYDEYIEPNILLEINGDYWHGPDFPRQQKRDGLKEVWAIENGYRFAVVWEHEINDWGVEEALMHSLNGGRDDD